MSNITLITPPDKVFNQNTNIFLLYPSEKIKSDLQDVLADTVSPVNIYLYENTDEHDIDWLLSIHKLSDIVLVELEQLPSEIKQIEAYLISQSNTYWLTKGENVWYNKLSVNKIYDLNFLTTKLGGTVERK
jgi:flagellar biosynthesis protein FliP